MVALSSWSVSAACILSQGEIDRVWSDLEVKAKESKQSVVNRVIFALSTYCGLRVSEVIGITVEDVALDRDEPVIFIRGVIAKGGKSRAVPIMSRRALEVLKAWKAMRWAMGGDRGAPFVCSLSSDSLGNALDRQNARKRFKTAIACLGDDRVKHTTIHHGRHTMASNALAKGVPIVAVKEALGHSSIAVTNIYAHLFEKKRVNID